MDSRCRVGSVRAAACDHVPPFVGFRREDCRGTRHDRGVQRASILVLEGALTNVSAPFYLERCLRATKDRMTEWR